MRLLLVFISLLSKVHGATHEMTLPGTPEAVMGGSSSAFSTVKQGFQKSPSMLSMASSTTMSPPPSRRETPLATPRSRAGSSPLMTWRSATSTPRSTPRLTLQERIDALSSISYLRGEPQSWWAGFFEVIL